LDQSCSVGDALVRAEREQRQAVDAEILPPRLLLDQREADRALHRVESLLALKFGIHVTRLRLSENRTGVLQGTSILLDVRLPTVTQLFFLLHLAGHTFQFTSADQSSVQRYFSRSALPYENRVRERRRYEQEATAFGLSILVELGATETLQGWFRRMSALDFQYGKRYVEDNENSVTLKNSEAHVADWWDDLPPKNPPEQQRRRVEDYWSS
jgi:hypothetical protein